MTHGTSQSSEQPSPVTEPWPDGVIARYLTVAGATVDISYASHSGVIVATCTGERCGWQERTDTYGMSYDPPEKEEARVDRWLPENQQEAQAHAEKCRALRRPQATG